MFIRSTQAQTAAQSVDVRSLLSDARDAERRLLARATAEERLALHPEASGLLRLIAETARSHLMSLQDATGQTPQPRAAAINSCGPTATCCQQRSEAIAAVCEHFSAVGAATMTYTALHAAGLAMSDMEVAELAQRHLEDLAPLLIELNKSAAYIIARELASTGEAIDMSIGPRAAQETHEAWTGLWTGSALTT